MTVISADDFLTFTFPEAPTAESGRLPHKLWPLFFLSHLAAWAISAPSRRGHCARHRWHRQAAAAVWALLSRADHQARLNRPTSQVPSTGQLAMSIPRNCRGDSSS